MDRSGRWAVGSNSDHLVDWPLLDSSPDRSLVMGVALQRLSLRNWLHL